MKRRHNRPLTQSLGPALEAAGLKPDDIAWFEHIKGRKFAPLPDCKLRKLAMRAGFRSSAEFLAAERAKKARHAATQ
jgi:hypothetical protein